MKGFLITSALAVAGYYISERFIIKQTPDSTQGFIDITPGFGLDELARGATIGATVHWGRKLFGSML